MSDGQVTTICSTLIQLAVIAAGFLTLWVKLRYGADKLDEAATKATVAANKADVAAVNAARVESKVDSVADQVEHNTVITTAAKDAAGKAAEHSEVCDSERTSILGELKDHQGRITALETKMAALAVSVDSVSKNIDSTRHELRSNLQSITNKLDTVVVASVQAATIAQQPTVQRQPAQPSNPTTVPK